MKLNFKQVLVTGGAGFIGSHLVDRLIKEKCQVTVIDDLSTGRKANLSQHAGNRQLRFLHTSILDPAKLREAAKSAERVFHEAAIVSSEYANQHPTETSQINVQGTLNLLETARLADIEHLTYASSAAVYGNWSKLPIREDAPTKPLSPYGATKLSGEHFVDAYYRTYGLKTTSLRYFNVYGPRQIQNPYSGVITVFLQKLLSSKALEIQGDGEQTRDFIYVSDVAKANLKAASSKAAVGEVFNIATGKTTSVNELAITLGSLLDVSVKRTRMPRRRGDIRDSYADIQRAREILGFEAKVTFRRGLQQYVNWFKHSIGNTN